MPPRRTRMGAGMELDGTGWKNSALAANAFSIPTSPPPTTSAASIGWPPRTQWISRCSEFLNSKFGPSPPHRLVTDKLYNLTPKHLIYPQSSIRADARKSNRRLAQRGNRAGASASNDTDKTNKRMHRRIRNANGARQKQTLCKQASEICPFTSANPGLLGSSVPIRLIRG